MTKNNTIGGWQAGILVFFLIFANKILVFPSLLFDYAKFTGILAPIFFFLIEFGILILFYKLKTKYPNERFFDLVKMHFGRVATIVIAALFGLFFFGKFILLYNITYIFFRNLIYEESNNFLFLICFLPVVNHLAICGLRTLGRTAQLFFPLVAAVLVFTLIVGCFGINSAIVIEQSSLAEAALTGLKHIGSFGDCIILFLFMDKIEIKKSEWKVFFSLAALAMVGVLAIVLIFFLSYTYTTFLHPFSFFDLLSFVKEYGGLGRIDIISMVFVIVLTYFHLAIYLSGIFVCFDKIFPKLDRIYSVVSFNFAFVLIVCLAEMNLGMLIFFGENILTYLSAVAYVIAPICALVGLIPSHKKRKEL